MKIISVREHPEQMPEQLVLTMCIYVQIMLDSMRSMVLIISEKDTTLGKIHQEYMSVKWVNSLQIG